MPRYYKVRLPKRIASQWAKARPDRVEGDDVFVVHGDPGVTFRVSDIEDGRVPAESTVESIEGVVHTTVGLSDEEAAEVLASMAVAERASQPDRLPLVVALVCALLTVILASGVVQTAVDDARQHLIEERVKRPRAQYGWSARVGATKKALGLQGNRLNIPHEKPKQRFFPSLH